MKFSFPEQEILHIVCKLNLIFIKLSVKNINLTYIEEQLLFKSIYLF